MDLYPAGGRGDVLPLILGSPSLDEGHSDDGHLVQVVGGVEVSLGAVLQ